jgi:hypothetical protein
MTIAHVASLGTAQLVASPTLDLTIGQAANVGDFVIVMVAKANEQTTDGVSTETAISDLAGGNQWVRLGEYCNGNGAADAGEVCAMWLGRMTAGMPISTKIRLTVSGGDGKASAAMSANLFTHNTAMQIAASTPNYQVSETTPASSPLSGLKSQEYLFIRAEAKNSSGNGLTATAGGFVVTAGDDNTKAAINGEWLIATATSKTSAPTNAESKPRASVFCALYDSTQPYSFGMHHQWI